MALYIIQNNIAVRIIVTLIIARRESQCWIMIALQTLALLCEEPTDSGALDRHTVVVVHCVYARLVREEVVSRVTGRDFRPAVGRGRET